MKKNNINAGFSLAEVLVATAIFTIIIIAALLVYDRSNQVFNRGVEAGDMQQNTRVAFDKLVQDLRMAGFDFDRDGIPTGAPTVWQPNTAYATGDVVVPPAPNNHAYIATNGGTSGPTPPTWPTAPGATVEDPTGGSLVWQENGPPNRFQQPDEQIEFAGRRAVTIRGNYDYETDAANDHGREGVAANAANNYESTQFPVVTTANDEIVTYALVSGDASKNTDEIRFFADTAVPRRAYPGGIAENEVVIGGVDLSGENPPYTLYRIHLAHDGSLVRQPLANNIRDLRLAYYEDTTATTILRNLAIPPAEVPDFGAIGGGGQFDPNNAAAIVADRNIRAKIRSIGLELVGMNPVSDAGFTDPDETVASAVTYRKYRLESTVVPRNLGRRGLREQDAAPPGPPTITGICYGYCGFAKISWQAPATGGAVDNYAVIYDTDLVGGFARVYQASQATEALVPIPDPSVQWYFKVKALNSFGESESDGYVTATPLNATKPGVPENGQATGGPAAPAEIGQITVSWTAPVTNASGTYSCTGVATPSSNPPLEEIAGFNVYRSKSSSFTASASTLYKNWYDSDGPVLNRATGEATFVDTNVSCDPYYYRVVSVERCGLSANASWNQGGNANLGLSDPSPIIMGKADPTGNAPAAPLNLNVETVPASCTSSGSDEICVADITFSRVTEDTAGNTIGVDRYEWVVTRENLSTGAVEDIATSTELQNLFQPITNALDPPIEALITRQLSLPVQRLGGSAMEDFRYTIAVRANYCAVLGDSSAPRKWPCDFAGGSATVDISLAAAFDGNGSATAPFLIQAGDALDFGIAISGGTAVSVTANVIVGGAIVDSLTGSGSGSSWRVSSAPVNADAFQVVFELMDSSGCTLSRTVYVETSTSACCIRTASGIQDTSIVSWTPGQDTISFNIDNICSENLSLTALRFAGWKSNFPNGTSINSIVLIAPDGSTSPINVPGSTKSNDPFSHTLSTSRPLPANAEGYRLQVTFSKSSASQTPPISNFCLTYSDSDAVSSVCQFYPGPSSLEDSCDL